MVSVPGRQSQLCCKNRPFFMTFAQNRKTEIIFDLFGDILESPDFLFAQKGLKTAVASALNSNNNKETQR